MAHESENLYSLDAEQAILGALIKDRDVMGRIADKVSPDSFHVPAHNRLFALFSRMYSANEEYDLVTLIDLAVRGEVFDTVEDSRAYLTKLFEASMTFAGLEKYAAIVAEKHMLRSLCLACDDIREKAVNAAEAPEEVLDFAEQKIYDLRQNRDIRGLVHIKSPTLDKYKELTDMREHPEQKKDNTMSSSFHELDNYIYGLNKSDLIILAARPGMGKTSFALNVGLNTAKRYRDKRVAVFSFEMSTEQLVSRLISSEAMISSDKLRSGLIEDDEWKRLQACVSVLARLEIYVDDTPNVSVNEMKAKLRRVSDLGLVIVDYLQLMSTGRREQNRVNDISELTRNLKIMAKELNVPVLLLSQLSRGVESREDKRPRPADLRDSGSIEQDADIILFLYNDHVYNPENSRPSDYECIVAKNRQGATGVVPLFWDGRFTKFSGVDRVHGVVGHG